MTHLTSPNGEWRYVVEGCWKRNADYQTKPCPNCGGAGVIGGGFKSIDGPETCWQCHGHGKIVDYSVAEHVPEHPKELVDALKKTYAEYMARMKQ